MATFLEFACWDHRVHGKGDHRMYDRAAGRLLAQHPEIAHDSLYTAVVCGDLLEVERRLAERPETARESGGPRNWPPLLYLCYTRFSHLPTIDNAVAMARALLDRGADPNAFYKAGDSDYTALVGVAGEGEQDSPRQPEAEELFQLLLARGAKPFDIQVLYNTHFSGDMLWWLELVYGHTMKTADKVAWSDPDWKMLDMGGYGTGASFVLGIAIEKNDLTLAKWALAHGARADALEPPRPRHKATRTLYEVATLEGRPEMAALLVRYGARRTVPALDEQGEFLEAVFRKDREAAEKYLASHPETLQAPELMFEVARRGRADVIAFMLDLGFSIEVSDECNTRALHHAAVKDAREVVELLIARGAEIDPRESRYGGTPIGWAAHADHQGMMDYLSQFSRNVWTLSFRGYVARLREVLRAEPDRASAKDEDGFTPLWWLPDDEPKALAIVDLLVAHGADPAARSSNGTTAMDWALKRGMRGVAQRLLEVGGRGA